MRRFSLRQCREKFIKLKSNYNNIKDHSGQRKVLHVILKFTDHIPYLKADRKEKGQITFLNYTQADVLSNILTQPITHKISCLEAQTFPPKHAKQSHHETSCLVRTFTDSN
ncbi:hypothetical protein AMECASPLE_036860 [Ameca splendens]|uniref:Uncharacterized protein n=1 Tax=Ameca splendens TaxID=208324 RepID=A0ABV0XKT7_9TELE